jgi:hypothetical protein
MGMFGRVVVRTIIAPSNVEGHVFDLLCAGPAGIEKFLSFVRMLAWMMAEVERRATLM